VTVRTTGSEAHSCERAEQALAVEQDRARQAEQERDAERSRAKRLSALLEATRLQLA
jgi:hypothetical protein